MRASISRPYRFGKEMITIFFNGKPIQAQEGDTVASALYRNGMRIFTRSFKYHRPRGLLCLAGNCPNCLMNVNGTPNVRTCTTSVHEGMKVKHQNAYPSLEHDWLSTLKWFDWLMPVGFYYKTFINPPLWRFVEPMIRKVAGLGEIPDSRSQSKYEHVHLKTDIAIVGGGPAGLMAAIDSAKTHGSVTLIDDQPELGGHLRYQKCTFNGYGEGMSGLRGVEIARRLSDQVEALPNICVIRDASCFGFYEGNLLGIVQHNLRPEGADRLIHLRTGHITVATGAYEVPMVFENNDLVGIMFSTAIQRLVNAHGIKPAENAVIISDEEDGGQVADDLREADVEIAAIIRPGDVVAARGNGKVAGIKTKDRHIACDLIVVCGPKVPDVGLIAQAGGKLEWDEQKGAFVPADLPPYVTVVGDVTGESLRHRREATRPLTKESFICLCEDVTARDICDAIDEGFDQMETLKRYTTVSMGPCQGKMCKLASIDICARQTQRTIGETGTTTSRPPTPPVSLGALAGARHHPIKRTPMDSKHDELDCAWTDMGEWKRAHHYKQQDVGDQRGAVEMEYRAVREGVGIIDVSTLGKLDVKGKDAHKLLDKVYTNRLSDLRIGRVRYSVILDDTGIILDDGTISRLSDDHFFITTTTGNIEFAQQWLEWWAVETGWCVHITNVTGGLAAINVAGPMARDVLSKLTDCDLSTKAFPYMACRRAEMGKVDEESATRHFRAFGEVGGVPSLLLRIGFVGEMGWEIHFPAEYGEYLWDAIMEVGKEFGIVPFGVEAQRILRLEKRHIIVGVDTDATSNPISADMFWAAKMDKEDFIGRAAILRIQKYGIREKSVGFVMQDDVVPEDGNAIGLNGKPVGRVTSVRFSPFQGKAVGLAWVPPELSGDGQEIQIHVDGQVANAQITSNIFYDPEGKRLRS